MGVTMILLHAQTLREYLFTIKNQLSPKMADELMELLKYAENVAKNINDDDELNYAALKLEEFLL